MSSIKKEFSFSTVIKDNLTKYGSGKVVCTADISAGVSFDLDGNDGEWDNDYATIEYLRIEVSMGGLKQDISLAYIVDKAIGGNLAELIDKEILAMAQNEFVGVPVYQVIAGTCSQLNDRVPFGDVFGRMAAITSPRHG